MGAKAMCETVSVIPKVCQAAMPSWLKALCRESESGAPPINTVWMALSFLRLEWEDMLVYTCKGTIATRSKASSCDANGSELGSTSVISQSQTSARTSIIFPAM